MTRALLLSVVSAALTACGPPQQATAPDVSATPAADDPAAPGEAAGARDATPGPASPAGPTVAEVSLADVGLDAAAMDPRADPCTDFYRYACGGWMDGTEIPADRARYGRFTEVSERNEAVLHRILEQASAAGDADPATAKLGAFYAACMDAAAVEAAGTSAIDPLLAAVGRVRSRQDVVRAITRLHGSGIWAAFTWEAYPDFKDSTTNILFVDTGGLGLPDRDYYLGDDDSFTGARAFYRGHVERMFALLGKSAPAARRAAGEVLRIETALARVTKTKVQRRDVQGMYHRLDRAGLVELAPGFGWDRYFAAFGGSALRAINVTTPDYFSNLDRLLRRIPPAAWRSYLEWQILHHTAETLPEAFVAEDFALQQVLTGQLVETPRWKRCIAATNQALGELLGQRYVAAQFAGNSKEIAEALVREIGAAFAAEVGELPWMSEATRQQALAKLGQMSHLIGYPDRWKTYGFAVTRDNHAGNMLAARAFEVTRQLDKVEKPYDRGEWFMNPQRVNAYYNPFANQMVFPAGILQPPFFAADRGVAVNLGAIGMVVGHELTHGFDDMGAQFDGDGNLRDWWQAEDRARFEKRGECLSDQYDQFEPVPGARVDGSLTLGENIADVGGLKLAFRAYRRMRRTADPVYRAGGLGEDQQFFVAFGQAWCSRAREAELRRLIVVDSHAPPRFRVIGALRNTPEFAAAFRCREGAPMHPSTTCEIW